MGINVAPLHAMTIDEALKVSAKIWTTPADWPVFFDSKRGYWNIRIGMPEYVARGISVRPYQKTETVARVLDEVDIRKEFEPVLAERVIAVMTAVKDQLTAAAAALKAAK